MQCNPAVSEEAASPTVDCFAFPSRSRFGPNGSDTACVGTILGEDLPWFSHQKSPSTVLTGTGNNKPSVLQFRFVPRLPAVRVINHSILDILAAGDTRGKPCWGSIPHIGWGTGRVATITITASSLLIYLQLTSQGIGCTQLGAPSRSVQHPECHT